VTGRPHAADPHRADAAPNQGGVRLSTEVAREIIAAISGLRYGSVEITVHESRVVQIERRERARLDSAPASRAGELFTRGHPKPSTDGDLTNS
jgi:hypothetical protein